MSMMPQTQPSVPTGPVRSGVGQDHTCRDLAIAEIEVSRSQPRQQFDPATLASLAASIEQHGLLQPIIVREVAANRYQIIAGERRFQAFRQLGRTVIPAMVISSADPTVLALVENLQRGDLHVLEMAAALDQLIQERGLTQETAGLLVGKSPAHIARVLGLMTLPPAIRSEIPGHPEVAAALLLEIAETADPKLQVALWEQAKQGPTIRARHPAAGATPRPPASPALAIDLIHRTAAMLHDLKATGTALPADQRGDLQALRDAIDTLLADGTA